MVDQEILRQKLADKVWNTLFGGGDSALLPPWRIRSGRHDHRMVREAEMAAVRSMLADLDDLHAGRQRLNTLGELVEAAPLRDADNIRFNPLIELAEEDPLSALRVPDTAAALQSVRREADIQALRQSLNVRRIGLRADMLSETVEFSRFSEKPVEPDWLWRWKEMACRAVSDDFQDMWARVLVQEVCRPGIHSLRILHFLSLLSSADIATVRLMARLDLGGFICRDASGYYMDEVHEPMLEHMRQMGLISDQEEQAVTLKSVTEQGFRCVLRCQGKALYIEGDDEAPRLSIIPFTLLGREVVSLFPGMADSAYLFALGNELKRRGFRIDIGDWVGQAGGSGLFIEKMSL